MLLTRSWLAECEKQLFAKISGAPKLEMDQQEDKTMLKCSASANEHPPRLSWLMDNGLEIAGKYMIVYNLK